MPRYSLFRRFVSLLLAVVVLTASVGLTVQRHTCRMSGRSKVNVTVPGRALPQGCNSQAATANTAVEDNCCDTTSHLHKLSAPAHELAAKVLVPVPVLVARMPEMQWPPQSVTVALPGVGPRWLAADSSPPPLAGRELLAFVCTLVV
ncbi:MAG TPA: hypothetical protein VF629_11230 [Hymenobacter sp.]|jgi:hypothetical protein|uniref:HYC_CC_PP family protein n=1 Tax=Hymenobacter sp. TaxID=1898978 RepID=UPI002ED857BD